MSLKFITVNLHPNRRSSNSVIRLPCFLREYLISMKFNNDQAINLVTQQQSCHHLFSINHTEINFTEIQNKHSKRWSRTHNTHITKKWHHPNDDAIPILKRRKKFLIGEYLYQCPYENKRQYKPTKVTRKRYIK